MDFNYGLSQSQEVPVSKTSQTNNSKDKNLNKVQKLALKIPLSPEIQLKALLKNIKSKYIVLTYQRYIKPDEVKLMHCTLQKINDILPSLLEGKDYHQKKIKEESHEFTIHKGTKKSQIQVAILDHLPKNQKYIFQGYEKKVAYSVHLNKAEINVSMHPHKGKENNLIQEDQNITHLHDLKEVKNIIPKFSFLINTKSSDGTPIIKAFTEQFFPIDDLYQATSQVKLKICLDIARSLKTLHAFNFVHCDVKMDNVLCTEEIAHATKKIEAKLADFGGLVKSGEEVKSRSLPFISPEQVLGYHLESELGTDHQLYTYKVFDLDQNYRANSAMDMFSYGVILYYALTDSIQLDDKYLFELTQLELEEFFNNFTKEISLNFDKGKDLFVSYAFIELMKELLVQNPSQRLSSAKAYEMLNHYYHKFNKTF